MRHLPVLVVALLPLAWGCSASPEDHLRQAREAMAKADYAAAAAKADAGLQATPEGATAWGLELVRLEAHARLGNEQEVTQQLGRLEQSHGEHLKGSRYVSLAQQLQLAGKGAAAIKVLDMGHKRFPEDKDITAMIEKAKSNDKDPETLETLRSLGYIQ